MVRAARFVYEQSFTRSSADASVVTGYAVDPYWRYGDGYHAVRHGRGSTHRCARARRGAAFGRNGRALRDSPREPSHRASSRIGLVGERGATTARPARAVDVGDQLREFGWVFLSAARRRAI